MEFGIKPYHKNSYPRRGILIKSTDAGVWLKEMYRMGLDPEGTHMYALAGKAANQLYGCLVILKEDIKITDLGKNSYMQCLNNKLFIPENAVVFPELSHTEWDKLFTAPAYVMHQDIGLAELTEEIDWSFLLEMPQQALLEVTIPSKSTYIPNTIYSFSIEADEEKLAETIEGQAGTGTNGIPVHMDKIMKGNQKEIDKLLKYLEKHPEAALSIGIPLDIMGTSRGGGGGRFTFGKTDSGLFNSNSGIRTVLHIALGVILVVLFIAFIANSGGKSSAFPIIFIFAIGRLIYSYLNKNPSDLGWNGNPGPAATISNDKFAALQSKYEELANEFIAKKEYYKASGVYLKLLKNNIRAAQVLEEGGYYGEAGAIYLKYCKDKIRAAECFEKGKLYSQAIEIYKELGRTEKVADLYKLLNQEQEAGRYYEMVAEDYIKNKQYVKASLVYRKKMNQPLRAQELLLEGWHKNLDAHNCLNNYFANIIDTYILIAEIKRFYASELKESRSEAFLQVLKTEFRKHELLQVPVKEIAYKIIAQYIETKPSIVSELISFNPMNKSLSKDIMKFRLQNK